MAILIDTSFLLAAFYVKDAKHVLAAKAIRSLKASQCIVPESVLHELFHVAQVRMNYERAIDAVERVHRAHFDIQSLGGQDRLRMTQIMHQYASASFDYTDAAIMALSERLNIKQVYTFDRRDFNIFRPNHCLYLELLPE